MCPMLPPCFREYILHRLRYRKTNLFLFFCLFYICFYTTHTTYTFAHSSLHSVVRYFITATSSADVWNSHVRGHPYLFVETYLTGRVNSIVYIIMNVLFSILTRKLPSLLFMIMISFGVLVISIAH